MKRKKKRAEPIAWSLEDWCRGHREELQKHPDARALVHPELGILVAETGRSETFLLKVATIRRSVVRDCKIFLVSEMLQRLNTAPLESLPVVDGSGWVSPFDDPWNNPDYVLDGVQHPNMKGDDPLLDAVLNEMTGSTMKLPEHARTSAFRQPSFVPMPRPYSPSRAVIDGAGKMRRGR